MNITRQYLTISNYNRPGTKRRNTTSVACHYIGNPGTSAQANRNWFESLRAEGPKNEAKGKKATKASAQYIIGLDGEIIQMVPEEEISWCTNSANGYTISIEACHPDATGEFTEATYKSYVWLCADICKRWGLDPEHGGLIRHRDVTGKVCPKWFVDHPDAWEQFKRDVAAAMQPDKKSGWYQEDGGTRYYNGDTGLCVRNDWREVDNKWYWFDGAGMMVTNTWYQYQDGWYYLSEDGTMLKGLQAVDCKWYYLDQEGKMTTQPITLTPDKNGALRYSGVQQVGEF